MGSGIPRLGLPQAGSTLHAMDYGELIPTLSAVDRFVKEVWIYLTSAYRST